MQYQSFLKTVPSTDLYYKSELSLSIPSLFRIPKLIPATFDPLAKTANLFRSKSWSSSEFVFLTAVSATVLVARPHSWLQCDRPCRSNLVRQLRTNLRESSRKFLTCAFLLHVLGTLQTAASFLPLLRNQVVTASFLEFSRLGNDRRQRLSSEFVARSAATFGVGRNHTDAKATE